MKKAPILLGGLLACSLSLAAGAAVRSNPPTRRAGRAPAGTMCAAGEQIIFSCQLRGSAKLVSLCGSKTLSRDEGHLQYRFGRPGRIELEFPKNRADSQKQFSYEHVFRFQFDRTEIGFENEGFLYTLFDYYDGEQKPARREAGVRVRAAGENAGEVTMRCGSRVTASYGDLNDILADQ